jgi:selenocysteine lyase/cysteine desulfurase
LSAGIAGTLAAVDYLTGIGEICGRPYAVRLSGLSGRRLLLKMGMTILREYDHVLGVVILDELETLPEVRICGITDQSRIEERMPTVSVTWGDRYPRDIAAALGEQGIFVWDGN